MRGICAALALVVFAGMARAECLDGPAFAAQFPDPRLFQRALDTTATIAPATAEVRGVIVPHHLEVADLIAGGLRLASGEQPDLIVFLTPDHFRAAPAPFATSGRGFETALGPVPGAPQVATALVAPGLVAPSCLFARDHGIGGLTPFLAHLFPGVPVLPVAVALNSTHTDWDAFADRLAPLMTPRTLMVQSTDFSHYLPPHEARAHDQQVLNLYAARDWDALTRLIQPDHIDSVGAAYVTATLQERVFGTAPQIVANVNQQERTTGFLAETTSYIVALFTPPDAPADPPPFTGSHDYMLGGDLFLGRALPRILSDELAAARIEAAARDVTRGLPLIVNLEGVVLDEVPEGLPHLTLAMPTDLLGDWVARLNIAGVGLANNHARDMGPGGLADTRAALGRRGIPHAAQGERIDLAGVTLVMLTDLDGAAMPPDARLTSEILDALLIPDASVPVVAFVHWGREYVTEPSPRDQALTEAMRARGVTAIVGAHPHAASAAPVAIAGGEVVVIHSLGNFLFDQTGARASGAVAHLRTFAQGTLTLRQLPVPQLFDLARLRP